MFNIWNNVLAEIETSLPHEAFVTWFDGVHLISTDDGIVRIGATNIFKVNQIKNRYDKEVRAALAHIRRTESDILIDRLFKELVFRILEDEPYALPQRAAVNVLAVEILAID